MSRLFSQFALGFNQPFSAVSMILRYRGLALLSLIPLAIFSILFVLGISFSWGQFVALYGWVEASLSFLGFLGPVLGFIAAAFSWLLFVVAMTYVNYVLGTVLASPFLSLMAEKTFALEGRPAADGGWGRKLKVFFKMFWLSLLKGGLFLIIGIFLFAISFVPLLTPIGTFAAILIVIFDCSDYGFEALEWGLRQRFQFFLRHLPAYSGLALTSSLAFLIPGLFLIFLPVFVVAATQVTHELLERYDP